MAGGYDTADTIQSIYSAADSAYGTPNYWLRYFSPCTYTPVNASSSNANSECSGAWNSGGKYVSPITFPTQSRLSSNSSAEGQADAQTLASALISVYQWVIPLDLPSNGELYCWLDQETNTTLSSGYWSGWSSYINGYNWEGYGTYPLYACLYCNPCQGSSHPNCSTVSSVGGCYAIWASEWQVCGHSLRSLPSWDAQTCSGCGSSGPSTVVWQFADVSVCSLTVNVDMDDGAISAYSFYVSANP